MLTIHELPALRLFVLSATSIILFYAIDPVIVWRDIFILSFCTMSLAIFTLYKKYSYTNRFYYSFGILSLWICCNLLILSVQSLHLQKDTLINQNIKNGPNVATYINGVCASYAHTKKVSYFTLRVHNWSENRASWYKSDTKVQIFTKDTSIISLIKPGVKIILKTVLSKPQSALNPEEFDFSKYLANQQITLQGSCEKDDIKVIEERPDFLNRIINSLRHWTINKIDTLLQKSEEADVAAALLIGYRDKIDPQTNDEFIRTGSVHLLAVSGMHVVLIYSNVLLVLGLFWKKKSKNFKYILALIIVWIFAAITGLAPSVTRASMMLSLLILGQILNRQSHAFNIVFGGALLMILYNPMLLFDTGFQLSLSAVVGIIGFKKWIDSKMLIFLSAVPRLKDLVTVTIAAQLGTLPFILFYFHQFPVYFILSGIAAVVISDLIIKIGMVILLISLFVQTLAISLAVYWKMLISSLLWVINFISNLPGPLIDNIYCSPIMFTVGLFSLIIGLIAVQQKMDISKPLVLILLLWIGIDFTHFIQYRNHNEIIVYNAGRKRLLGIQNGYRSIIFADSTLTKQRIKQISQNHQITNCVFSSSIIRIPENVEVTLISKETKSGAMVIDGNRNTLTDGAGRITSLKNTVFIEKENPALSRVDIHL